LELQLTDYAKKLLNEFYCLPGESIEELYERCADAWSRFLGVQDVELKSRLLEYFYRQWLVPASPVLSNAPDKAGNVKGLPISCFLSSNEDTVQGLIDHTAETRWLTVKGGGVGGYWGNIRSAYSKIGKTGGNPVGVIPHLMGIAADMLAYKQGNTRKGSYAAYLDISHPDIEEFIEIRKGTGDRFRRNSSINHAVIIPDSFMRAVIENQRWDLIDPHTKEKVKDLNPRKLLHKLIEIRAETGEPYILFIDNVNRAIPTELKDLGYIVKQSNLCIEIMQMTDEKRTAVCCLSSVNLEKFDEWKDSQMIEDSIRMLDNILEYFIANAGPELVKSVLGAKEERSLGLGTMGFHSLLQSKMLSFESSEAKKLNKEVFSLIKAKAVASSQVLGTERGLPKFNHNGQRNAHLLAIAPNSNNSLLANVSPSIEPIQDNYMALDTRAGTQVKKNAHLERLLESKEQSSPEVWATILDNSGSVQHLDCLSLNEKNVFKTAFEVDQTVIIELAADRQKHICQSQSLNLFYKPTEKKSRIEKDIFTAWKSGVKSLYYQRGLNKNKVDNMNNKVELVVDKPKDSPYECVGCES